MIDAAADNRRHGPPGRRARTAPVTLLVAAALFAATTAGATVMHTPTERQGTPPATRPASPGPAAESADLSLPGGADPILDAANILAPGPPPTGAAADWSPIGGAPALLSGARRGERAGGFRSSPATGQAPWASRPGVMTVRDLLKLYLNRPRPRSAPAAGPRPASTASAVPSVAAARGRPSTEPGSGDSAGGGGLLDAVLDMTVGPGLVEALAAVLRPSIDSSGVVAFSVAGFGRFVLLQTDDRQAIRLIDARSGASITVAGADKGSVARASSAAAAGRSERPAPARRLRPMTIREFVFLMLDYVLEPLPIAAVLGVIVLWVAWRVRAGGA